MTKVLFGNASLVLQLAASPLFAVMAFATRVHAGYGPDPICSSGGGTLLSGMLPMYVVMSILHSTCWWRLIADLPRALRSTKRSSTHSFLNEEINNDW